jgi:murein DD-endopeptidase MepM/ murein hydrolase activator NlpD
MRKLLCVALTFIICSVSIYSFADDSTSDLQQQANELQEQIDSATNDLNEIDSKLSSNLQQVQKLDQTIASSEEELEGLNTQIDELKKSIEETEAKLTDVQERYDKQKSLLDARLIDIYEAGSIQYIDVLFGSASIADFISNYYLVMELASYDNDLLEVVGQEKSTIETAKKALEKNKEELVDIKQTQLKTTKVLENTKIIRERYIAKLSEEEQEVQAQIDEYKAQYAAVEAEIKAIALSSISEEYIGGVMAWPVPGYTTITSKYGMRTHPITGVYKLHSGVDISAPTGTNFIAAADGVVTKAEYNTAYGNMVMIDHGGGVSTLYAHGSEIMVEVGQQVKQKDVVLKVGQTGYATGPHAHFEVRINGTPTEPLTYITTSTQVTDNTSSSSEYTAD